jgi:hypothetical protein
MLFAAALAAAGAQLRVQADIFKLDLGTCQNTGTPLSDWDTIPTFTLDTNGVYQIPIHDFDPFSTNHNANAVLKITDNLALNAANGTTPATGMTCNNPVPAGLDVVYDGILVPAEVKDDYLYRAPCPNGSEMLFRFANLRAGTYHVTLFMGRTNDPGGEFGKVWVDDATGAKEPTDQNTGNFGGGHLTDPSDTSTFVPDPMGNPKTVTVTLKAGDYLWFGYMEDSAGGASGIIIRTWLDTDGDGIPDDWETHYGANPNDPTDANKHCGTSKLTYLQAYQLGLDPCDVSPPAVVSTSGNGSMAAMSLTFNKGLDSSIATNTDNYSISPNLTISAANYGANVVTLITSTQAFGATYTVSMKNLADRATNVITAGTTAKVNSYVLGTNGVLKFSYWGDATGGDAISGTDVGSLEADPRYPNSPSLVLPVYSFNSRDAFPDDSHDNYGSTIEGILTPKDTAQYTFFLRSDDSSQLWLSSDSTPGKLALIAEETGCCQAFLEPDPNQGAAWHDNGAGMGQTTLTPISLQAGKAYFIRTIHKEGGGGDYSQVAWRKIGDKTPAGSLTPIPGGFLSSPVALPVPPQVQTATPQFTSITKSADGSITIQWTGGGTLQAGAAVTGPWQDVTGATSPYNFKPTSAVLFGRIKQ